MEQKCLIRCFSSVIILFPFQKMFRFDICKASKKMIRWSLDLQLTNFFYSLNHSILIRFKLTLFILADLRKKIVKNNYAHEGEIKQTFKIRLKLVFPFFIFSPDDSPLKAMKNVFYFI